MTSGDVTIRYLQTHYPDKTVYLVGTPPLVESFQEAGIHLVNEKPDIVVIGFDTTLTYEKLSNACTFIREGALFLATHLDINCPTETGFIPDCGSFCAAISLSTGKQPKYLGKPLPKPWRWCWTRPAFPPRKWPLWATACIQMWLPA